MRHSRRMCSPSLLTMLSVAVLVLLSRPVYAETVLSRAWQDFNASAYAFNGLSGEFNFEGHEHGASIPGARSYSAEASIAGGFGDGHAEASVSQSVSLGGIGFQFSGSSSAYAEGYYVNETARARSLFEFEVHGQAETVTVDLTSVSLVNTSTGFQYGILNTQGGFAVGGSLGTPTLVRETIPPGNYRLVVWDEITENQSSPLHRSADYVGEVGFSNLVIAPGAFETNPLVVPDYDFKSVTPHQWFDPVAASEILFQTTDGSRFTEIEGLPSNFAQPFEVLADGRSLGFFGSEQSVNFIELLGHGVSFFAIKNIVPGVDPSSPTAFPIQLNFDTDLASFTMTPVSEPSTLLLAAMGLVVAVVSPRRVRRSKHSPIGISTCS